MGGVANACSGLSWQPTLSFDAERAASAFDSSFRGACRIALDEHAWVEHVPAWVTDAAALFEAVLSHAPWGHRTRRMYDRMVEEPRLTAWHGNGLDDPTLPRVVRPMARALGDRFGRAFDAAGAALYRDGADSVAWHSDRIDPSLVEPVIAIVSLGSARTLRMRSKARRGATRAFVLVPSDLFAMGGATNATWQHSVPKVSHAGARVSLQFRHST